MQVKFKKIISILTTGVMMCSGMTLTASALENKISEYKYSVADATEVQKYIVHLTGLSEEYKKLYDINNDGALTIDDATAIQKIVVGLEVPTENTSNPSVKPTVPTTAPQTTVINPSVEPTEAVSTIAVPATVKPTVKPTIAPTTQKNTIKPTEPTTQKPTTAPKSVKLNKTDITLGVGEQYTLTVTIENGTLSQVSFSTDDSKVAQVDDKGKITAVGVGTTKITAKTYNGKTASCNVTVKRMADSVKLDKTSITLGVTEQYDFSSSIPKDTAAYYRSYYSDNTAIAVIQKSGGLMTAKTAGTTTVRCKLSNGKEAVCKVTVKSAPSSVSLNYSSSTLKVGQSQTLTATYSSNAYSYRNTWTSSNTYVAAVNSNGKISAKSQGVATITYKTYNGKTASCKLTVSGSAVKCLDVSTWQGSIDFNKVKSAGYNYVIIRAGYGRENYQKDNTFEQNYARAKAAGLKVGVYWFSYATAPSEGYKEANACLYCLTGKQLDMPVYYDLEYQPAMSMSNANYTQMAVNFCNAIKKAGYKPGVYSSASVYGYLLNLNTLRNNGVSIWNAQWSSICSLSCDIWQYSEKGQVNGINSMVDLNYIYNLNVVG